MIKFLTRLLTAGCALLTTLSMGAQEKDPLTFGIYTSLGIPEGFTVGGAMRLMPELTVRAGIGITPQLTFSSRIDVNKAAAFAPYTNKVEAPIALDIKMNSSWLRGHLLLDYHPFKNPFRITTGLYVGNFHAHGYAQIINNKTEQSIAEELKNNGVTSMPIVRQEENGKTIIAVQPDETAAISASIAARSKIQPYLGIGYGFAVPHSRVSFFGDFGILYNGALKLSSPNVIEGDLNDLVSYSKTAANIIYWTQFLPILNLGISVWL